MMKKEDYENLSDDLKNAISSLATALWNAVNADTLEAMKSGIQRPRFATLLVYHLKNRAPEFLTLPPKTNPHKILNYRINAKDISAWFIAGDAKSPKRNSFTKETKIFLSVRDTTKALLSGWILIVNKKDGVYLPLSGLRLNSLLNSKFYFKNQYMRTKLMEWGGSTTTPQDWGVKYLYDITDYIMESINSDFINWPFEGPKELM